jgi:uncharacterized membrane protein
LTLYRAAFLLIYDTLYHACVKETPMRLVTPRVAPRTVAILASLALICLIALVIGVRGIAQPHFEHLTGLPIQIYIHLFTALFAFGLGLVMFIAPKGTLPHRALGWIWSVTMLTVAASSLWITGLNGHGYSPIHLLSGGVLIILPVALIAARRHKVLLHSRIMTGVFLGGMLIAGGFTFFPERLLWRVFFGGDAG